MIPIRAAHGATSGGHRQDMRRMVKLAHFSLDVAETASVSYRSYVGRVNLPTNKLSRRGS
jgi:hypothetical protein